MFRTVKYALIGCGRVSPNHIAAALENGLEIAAVSDLLPEKMEKLGQRFGLTAIRTYTDHRELLREVKPELCAVTTESGSHARIALDCIHAGAHVIIEKPIALSLADADQIIQEAKFSERLVCVCHQNRFNRSIQRIHKALEDGRFGKLLQGSVHVLWNRGEAYYREAAWRGTWAKDGGCLMNQGIHSIDLLRWMLGDPVEVTAFTDNLMHPYIEAEDYGAAIVRFRNGAYGMIEGTVNVFPANMEETLYLLGEKGTVKAGGKSQNRIETWRFADGTDDPEEVIAACAEDPPSVYGFGHKPLYADMISAIRSGRQPYVDGQAGRDALEMVLAIYRSAREHRCIEFPLIDGSTLEGTARR